jgi:hypothetical protein
MRDPIEQARERNVMPEVLRAITVGWPVRPHAPGMLPECLRGVKRRRPTAVPEALRPMLLLEHLNGISIAPHERANRLTIHRSEA